MSQFTNQKRQYFSKQVGGLSNGESLKDFIGFLKDLVGFLTWAKMSQFTNQKRQYFSKQVGALPNKENNINEDSQRYVQETLRKTPKSNEKPIKP